jgi:hypothetical protein
LQIGVPHVGIVQIGTMQVRTVAIGAPHRRAMQIGAMQVGIGQQRAAEVGRVQIASVQLGALARFPSRPDPLPMPIEDRAELFSPTRPRRCRPRQPELLRPEGFRSCPVYSRFSAMSRDPISAPAVAACQ